ncbi:M28 family peptidase [Hyphococcus formosus]|uniref:M28 family peptidase n=1 Tax=Hyphococcus formosus TaxID=3143534 RepID=UPI00398B062E
MRLVPFSAFFVFFIIFVAACAVSVPTVDVVSDTAAISRLKSDVAWFADDQRMGRKPGDKGYDDAADYVAERYEALGLEPAEGDRWKQEIKFRRITTQPNSAHATLIDNAGAKIALTPGKQFNLFPGSMELSVKIDDAPLVFVGYGIHAPKFGYDNYSDADIRGKIAIITNGAPTEFNRDQKNYFGSTSHKFEAAREKGAAAILFVNTKSKPDAERAPRVRRAFTQWVAQDGATSKELLPYLTLRNDILKMMFDGSGYSVEEIMSDMKNGKWGEKSIQLSTQLSLQGRSNQEFFISHNVVGLIKGEDPVLRNEVVVLTAHLDHLGVNDKQLAQGKDGTYNGAMDNATGVAIMLEVARMIQYGQRPVRSVAIVALTGEESGLLGSDYFAHFPPLGDKEIIANINLDMPILLHHFTDIVGFGAARSSLGETMENALRLSDVKPAPDPVPELGVFARSDHYSFVKQGVPSLFLWTGFSNGGEEAFRDFYKNHYHRPSDDLTQPILYSQMARFTALNTMIALEVANQKARPSWNQGDFYGELFGRAP